MQLELKRASARLSKAFHSHRPHKILDSSLIGHVYMYVDEITVYVYT